MQLFDAVMHHQPAHIQWIHLLQSDVMDQTITAIYPLHRFGNPHHGCETHFERIDPCDILHPQPAPSMAVET